MSLQKKIILSFLVSAVIIVLLAAFLSINFIEIEKETNFLELTDTIRSKSLQLRRHEKNFFLYAPEKAKDESRAVFQYLRELDEVLNTMKTSRIDRTVPLKSLVLAYRNQFSKIEMLVDTLAIESDRFKKASASYSRISRLIESNFLDRPLEDVTYLQMVFNLKSDHKIIYSLKELDTEIAELRKTGENILLSAKELDRTAREKVDGFIHLSRIAIIVFTPLFLIVGFGAILFIISGVVKRLKLITDLVEKTGKGEFTHVSVPASAWGEDEVGQLIGKFNNMEEQLEQREKELFQSKKLAAIGSLAAGVAHEMNNPLNNIHISAQVLQRELGDDCPPVVNETLHDIISQSMRVKRIVGDLLDYARGRELKLSSVEITGLIRSIYELLKVSLNMDGINFALNSSAEHIYVNADQEQIERVFINLFTNAVEAMSGKGDIIVTVTEEKEYIRIWISDTGKGISPEDMDKVFEPFFTTRIKGTGLGLAIVFNIIKKHKGEIIVDSQKEKGTTFYIVLPRGYNGP